MRFNEVAAECPALAEEEKTEMIVSRMPAKTGGLVGVRSPRNTKQAIAEAVGIVAQQADRSREQRVGRGEPPSQAGVEGRRHGSLKAEACTAGRAVSGTMEFFRRREPRTSGEPEIWGRGRAAHPTRLAGKS